MGAIFTSDKANPRHPFVDKSGVLASAEVAITVHTTWEDIIVYRAAPTFKPCQQAGPGVGQQFELNRASRFLLHHYCTRSYLPTADNVADFHPDKIATAELAVDREIKEGPVSQAAPLIEIKSDLPYLLRFQGTLCADCPSRIPDRTFGGSEFCFKHLHDCSPMAIIGHLKNVCRPNR
jgi:hypothetical protein